MADVLAVIEAVLASVGVLDFSASKRDLPVTLSRDAETNSFCENRLVCS